MKLVTNPLSTADVDIFYRKSANFAISRNTDIPCFLTHSFYFFQPTFFDSLKIVLINLVKCWMMSAKMATLGLLEIKVGILEKKL